MEPLRPPVAHLARRGPLNWRMLARWRAARQSS